MVRKGSLSDLQQFISDELPGSDLKRAPGFHREERCRKTHDNPLKDECPRMGSHHLQEAGPIRATTLELVLMIGTENKSRSDQDST